MENEEFDEFPEPRDLDEDTPPVRLLDELLLLFEEELLPELPPLEF